MDYYRSGVVWLSMEGQKVLRVWTDMTEFLFLAELTLEYYINNTGANTHTHTHTPPFFSFASGRCRTDELVPLLWAWRTSAEEEKERWSENGVNEMRAGGIYSVESMKEKQGNVKGEKESQRAWKPRLAK